jgi:excinuclease ABC subunit C
MLQVPDILDQRVDFDPAGDIESFLKSVPAKWVVYLFTDAENHPLQLLCVKNLRYSLKRRLSGEQTLVLSKRVDYREIVRRIHWRRVDSAFEADWIYHDLAQQIFPQTYQGMVGFRPAWFIHVNPETQFPRFTKTIDLSHQIGIYLGPLEDKHSAGGLIELIEDAFDLCRYYNILVEAPNGRACAYKEMGKCPAPCDGTISMSQYRRMIDWSVRTLIDPAEMIREQKQRMSQAAAEQRYEIAAKIKTFVDQLSKLGKGPYRHVRSLSDFAYMALQNGPKPSQAKVFLISGGWIGEIACVIDSLNRPSELLRLALSIAEEHKPGPIDEVAAGRIGVVANHLFTAKNIHGAFVPLADISEDSLAKAYKELIRQKRPEETEGEGVVKELQAM